MKDDIRKYLPDLATVLRETEPERIKERREKAVEGFKEGPVGAPANEVEPESSPRAVQRAGAPGVAEAEAKTGAGEAEAEAAETASPWVKGAPVAVPKEMLPSSLVPAAVPAPEAAKPKEAVAAAAGSGQAQKKKWPRWAPAVLAVLAVVVPLVLMWLATRPKGAPEGAGRVPAAASAVSAPSAVAPAAVSSSSEEGPAPGTSATAVPAAGTASSSAVAPEVDAGKPATVPALRPPSSTKPPRSPAPPITADAPTSSAPAPKVPETPFDKPTFD